MVFSGFNTASFSLTATPQSSGDAFPRAPINGIQIVQVPEPSGVALLTLGMGVIALRRRRAV